MRFDALLCGRSRGSAGRRTALAGFSLAKSRSARCFRPSLGFSVSLGLLLLLLGTPAAYAQLGNDDCTFAFPILDVAPISTAGATTDGSDLSGFCDPGPLPDDQIYDDVWYCYTAPISGPARASALFFAPGRIAVYDGCTCPDDPSLVIACAENDLMGFEVAVDFAVVAGQSYLVRVGGQSPGIPLDGLLEVGIFVPPVSSLTCDDSVPGEITVTWALPPSTTFDSIEIELNGSPLVTLGGTETTFTYVIPPAGPAFNQFCVTGVLGGVGFGLTACCSVGNPVPFNDGCAQAEPIVGGFGVFTGLGTTDGTSLAGFCDPGPLPDDQIYNDLWFCWTADFDGPANARLAQFLPFDLRAAVYDTCACPADPSDALDCVELLAPALEADLFFNAVFGETYLIRVGNAAPGLPGIEGVIEIVSGIPRVTNLACDDSVPGEVEMSWDLPVGTTYDSIVISEGGAPVATLPGSETSYTFTYPTPFVGFLTLDVQGTIGSFPPSLPTVCTLSIGTPDNDTCADAILLVEEVTLFDSSVAGDEADPFVGCPSPIGLTLIGQDIWFRYEAVETGDVTFSLCGGTMFDSILVLYEDIGVCPPDFTQEVACNDNFCGMQSEITYTVTEGQSYLLRLGGNLFTGGVMGAPGVLTVTGAFDPPVGDVFRRGDANGDGGYDVSDAVFSLAALFTPGSPSPACADAGDANDDGGFDVSDAVFTLASLFTPGSPSPADPGPTDCGEDPTADSLECDEYDSCP